MCIVLVVMCGPIDWSGLPCLTRSRTPVTAVVAAFPLVVVAGCASFATLPNVSKVLTHCLVVQHVGIERVKFTPPICSSIGGNAAVLLDLFHLHPQPQLRPLLKSVTSSPHSAVKLRLYETS